MATKIIKPNHQRILYFLKRDGPLKVAELAERVFITRNNVYKYLDLLLAEGRITHKDVRYYYVSAEEAQEKIQ
jgi:predicted ArsR family transcriptional regulator